MSCTREYILGELGSLPQDQTDKDVQPDLGLDRDLELDPGLLVHEHILVHHETNLVLGSKAR